MNPEPLMVVAGLLATGGTVVLSWRFLRHARRHWPADDDRWFGEGPDER